MTAFLRDVVRTWRLRNRIEISFSSHCRRAQRVSGVVCRRFESCQARYSNPSYAADAAFLCGKPSEYKRRPQRRGSQMPPSRLGGEASSRSRVVAARVAAVRVIVLVGSVSLTHPGLDIVAVRVQEERGIIAAPARTGRSVVSPSMPEARFVKGNDGFPRWGREGEVEGASSGAMFRSPEPGLGLAHPDERELRFSRDDHGLVTVSFGDSQPQ